jgi:hypothetical protein
MGTTHAAEKTSEKKTENNTSHFLPSCWDDKWYLFIYLSGYRPGVSLFAYEI